MQVYFRHISQVQVLYCVLVICIRKSDDTLIVILSVRMHTRVRVIAQDLCLSRSFFVSSCYL